MPVTCQTAMYKKRPQGTPQPGNFNPKTHDLKTRLPETHDPETSDSKTHDPETHDPATCKAEGQEAGV